MSYDSMAHQFTEESMAYQEQAITPAQNIVDGTIMFTDGSFVIVREGIVEFVSNAGDIDRKNIYT